MRKRSVDSVATRAHAAPKTKIAREDALMPVPDTGDAPARGTVADHSARGWAGAPRSPGTVVSLDLDETLVSTLLGEDLAVSPLAHWAPQPHLHVVSWDGASPAETMHAFQRPCAREFIAYLKTRFDLVMVWSAGSPSYVHAVCRWLFGASETDAPHAIFTLSDCGSVGVEATPVKSAAGILAEASATRPDLIFDASRLLIIDDRSEVYASAERGNVCVIPPFDVTTNAWPDDALIRIVRVMEGLQDGEPLCGPAITRLFETR
jgi:hypothetical protein